MSWSLLLLTLKSGRGVIEKNRWRLLLWGVMVDVLIPSALLSLHKLLSHADVGDKFEASKKRKKSGAK
jgi:hypothetical protein